MIRENIRSEHSLKSNFKYEFLEIKKVSLGKITHENKVILEKGELGGGLEI